MVPMEGGCWPWSQRCHQRSRCRHAAVHFTAHTEHAQHVGFSEGLPHPLSLGSIPSNETRRRVFKYGFISLHVTTVSDRSAGDVLKVREGFGSPEKGLWGFWVGTRPWSSGAVVGEPPREGWQWGHSWGHGVLQEVTLGLCPSLLAPSGALQCHHIPGVPSRSTRAALAPWPPEHRDGDAGH